MEADLTACSSASVSVANLLIAMTTGTPYCFAFWMCLHSQDHIVSQLQAANQAEGESQHFLAAVHSSHRWLQLCTKGTRLTKHVYIPMVACIQFRISESLVAQGMMSTAVTDGYSYTTRGHACQSI